MEPHHSNNNPFSLLPLRPYPADRGEIDHDDDNDVREPLDARPPRDGDEGYDEGEDDVEDGRYGEGDDEDDDDVVPLMDPIVVRLRGISHSPGDNVSPLPALEPEELSMHSATDNEDDDAEGDGDEEPEDADEGMVSDDDDPIVIAEDDEEEEEDDEDDDDAATSELLATTATSLLGQPGDYVVPTKEPDEQDENSTRDVSEKSPSVNGTADSSKIALGGRFTRGRKVRKGMPSYFQRRKQSTGRSRTPRAPSPVIPPRTTSPWPEIQESNVRSTEEDRDSKRRRITRQRQQPSTLPQDNSSVTPNGTKESTPQPGNTATRGTRRQAASSLGGLAPPAGGGGDDDVGLTPEERLKRSKRVKISPRKEKQLPTRQRSPPHSLSGAMAREEASGSNTPRLFLNIKLSEKEDSDPTKYNEENCGACGGPGRFLCCEGCPKSFHFTCLEPPIDENDLPDDSWYSIPLRKFVYQFFYFCYFYSIF